MAANFRSVLDEAIAWHIKSPLMREAQWEEFADWLEASAENRFEYDQVAKADSLLSQIPLDFSLLQTNRIEHQPFRHRNLVAASAAAALLVAVLVGLRFSPSTDAARIEQTSAGTVKQIAFAQGIRLALNGETRLALDQSHPGTARLEVGEVLFSVLHSQRSFVVEAGGFRILDHGTIFNVRLTDTSLELGVKEGSVIFDPEGSNLEVKAGETITVDRRRGLVVRGQSSTVGSWVDGELSFEDSSLAAVVAAMHRREGIDIRTTPALSGTPFTGNIKLSGDGATDAAHLARLIGAKYRREGDVWILSPSGAAH